MARVQEGINSCAVISQVTEWFLDYYADKTLFSPQRLYKLNQETKYFKQ